MYFPIHLPESLLTAAMMKANRDQIPLQQVIVQLLTASLKDELASVAAIEASRGNDSCPGVLSIPTPEAKPPRDGVRDPWTTERAKSIKLPELAILDGAPPLPEADHAGLRPVLEAHASLLSSYHVPVILGVDLDGALLAEDLAKLPHLIVGGASRMEVDAGLDTILAGFAFLKSPAQLGVVLVERAGVEGGAFQGLPHLVTHPAHHRPDAMQALRWLQEEHDARKAAFAWADVSDIQAFNRLAEMAGTAPMPHLVLVVREIADLMRTDDIETESLIARLCIKAKEAGIWVILGTSVCRAHILTGILKANINGRLAFKTASALDSRIIIDSQGAERLSSDGEILYATPTTITHGQAVIVREAELSRLNQHWKS